MPLRRRSDGGGGRRSWGAGAIAKLVAAMFGIGCLGLAAYFVYYNQADLKRFFSTPKPPDAAALGKAIEDAYSVLRPTKITTTDIAVGTRDVRHDLVVLPKKTSLLRANAEITRVVEKAGGQVIYGIESNDDKGRKPAVTLGISDGQGLVREIRLELGKK